MFKHISDRYCCVEIDAAGHTKISHHGSVPRTSDGFVRYDRAIHGSASFYHRLHVYDRKTSTQFVVLFTGLPESSTDFVRSSGPVAPVSDTSF